MIVSVVKAVVVTNSDDPLFDPDRSVYVVTTIVCIVVELSSELISSREVEDVLDNTDVDTLVEVMVLVLVIPLCNIMTVVVKEAAGVDIEAG